MYTRVFPPAVMGGAAGVGLAKTGFSTLVYMSVALVLFIGGLLLLRIAAVKRRALSEQR